MCPATTLQCYSCQLPETPLGQKSLWLEIQIDSEKYIQLESLIWITLLSFLFVLCVLLYRTAGAWLRNAPFPCLQTAFPRRSWPPSSAVTTVKAARGPVGIMPTSNRRTSCITVSWEKGECPVTFSMVWLQCRFKDNVLLKFSYLSRACVLKMTHTVIIAKAFIVSE